MRDNDDDDEFDGINNNLKITNDNYSVNLESNCDLIINKLNKICDKFKDICGSSSEDIINYLSFLNSFSSQIMQINNMCKESQKKKNMNNNYKDYYFDKFNNYNLLLSEKFSDLSSQIQRSIISPINIYKEKYSSEFNLILNNLKSLIEKIESENNNLCEIKKDYEKIKNNYDKEIDEENKKIFKEKMEEKIELYKLKINEINLCLMDYKIESENMVKDILNKQVSKDQSIKKSINNYFDIMNNFFIKSNEDINNFKTKINDISNNSINNYQFFNNIEFEIEGIKWEINDKKETINSNNLKDIKKNKKYSYKVNNNIKNNSNNTNNINNSNKLSYEDNYKSNNNKSAKSIINNFITHLFKKDDLEENEAAEFLFFLSEDNINIELYSYLCKFYNNYNKNDKTTIKKFLNFNNFTHFSNILNLMIENISNINDPKKQFDKYLLLDKIICIGEESVYENTFICSLLSNNKKLKNEKLWSTCLTYQLISELKNICENYYFTDKKKKGKSFLKIGKKLLGKIYTNDKNMKNNKDDIITQNGYAQFIPHYQNLSTQIKENICNKEIPLLIHNILKKYICHMSNYNFPLEGSCNLIEGIYYEFFKSKEPELMNFYINYSIASTFSVRKIIPIADLKKNNKSEELKRKIKEIKHYKYLVENKKLFSLENINNKYLILKNTLAFLTNKEQLKLINLNKNLHLLLQKDIYYYILTKAKYSLLNINEHIEIWKCYLKCFSIYKKTGFENRTYESIVNELISDQNFLNKFQNDIQTIDLDIPRSPFKQDIPSSSKAIKNILYTFLYINNNNSNIYYYQGMNYVATFLYEMTHKEEDSLLLLSGLFSSTEYSEIFSRDMEKMKKYLYVVERLVYIYLPKIYCHLIDNSLELNFFVNPIFISLFTNIYSSLPENDNSFLLQIWDDFILNGWKTIFTDVLTILKQNENKILNLHGEDLMKYLSDGITNGEMFTVYNYDEFRKEKNKFQPTKQLLEILSKESSLEEKLKN